MNREDIDEMYGPKEVPKKKKKYTGYACIVDQNGQEVTQKTTKALANVEFKKNYKHLKGYKVYYEFEWERV